MTHVFWNQFCHSFFRIFNWVLSTQLVIKFPLLQLFWKLLLGAHAQRETSTWIWLHSSALLHLLCLFQKLSPHSTKCSSLVAYNRDSFKNVHFENPLASKSPFLMGWKNHYFFTNFSKMRWKILESDDSRSINSFEINENMNFQKIIKKKEIHFSNKDISHMSSNFFKRMNASLGGFNTISMDPLDRTMLSSAMYPVMPSRSPRIKYRERTIMRNVFCSIKLNRSPMHLRAPKNKSLKLDILLQN